MARRTTLGALGRRKSWVRLASLFGPLALGCNAEADGTLAFAQHQAALTSIPADRTLAGPVWTAENEMVGPGVPALGSGDFNGDGYADWLVGNPSYLRDKGRVDVYFGAADVGGVDVGFTANPTDEATSFGVNVAALGDVDGDGFDDFIVAAFPGIASRERWTFLYLGGSDGPGLPEASAPDPSSIPGFRSIMSVSAAGDVNGDGYADALLGVSEGERIWVLLYLGAATGLGSKPAWTSRPFKLGNSMRPVSASGAGDVNGDGFADVLIGLPCWDGERENEGRVELYLGSDVGLGSALASCADPPDAADSFFGNIVAPLGDLDADGYADVMVTAHSQYSLARAYVYRGAPGGLESRPSWTVVSPERDYSDGFGSSAAGLGDVNGDGFRDVAIGAASANGEEPSEGRLYVYLGGPAGLSEVPAVSIDASDEYWGGFGSSLAVGDVNADGLGDVLVGATSDTVGAYLFLGSSTSTCRGAPAGQDCGVCAACDGSGNCVFVSDDDECGTISCDEFDTPCEDYHAAATDRCATIDHCKPPKSACTNFTPQDGHCAVSTDYPRDGIPEVVDCSCALPGVSRTGRSALLLVAWFVGAAICRRRRRPRR